MKTSEGRGFLPLSTKDRESKSGSRRPRVTKAATRAQRRTVGFRLYAPRMAAAAVGLLQGAAAAQGAIALGRHAIDIGGVLGNLNSLRDFVSGIREHWSRQAPEVISCR